MRSVRAASASDRSSLSDSMRESFTPAAGFSSYRVTTGPTVASTTLAEMPKCDSVSSMIAALRWISLGPPALPWSPTDRRSSDGSVHSRSALACSTPSAAMAACGSPAMEGSPAACPGAGRRRRAGFWAVLRATFASILLGKAGPPRSEWSHGRDGW